MLLKRMIIFREKEKNCKLLIIFENYERINILYFLQPIFLDFENILLFYLIYIQIFTKKIEN
jgi:hypothetical protein